MAFGKRPMIWGSRNITRTRVNREQATLRKGIRFKGKTITQQIQDKSNLTHGEKSPPRKLYVSLRAYYLR